MSLSSSLSPRGRGAYQAFTLIELLTVIAIIGILAAVTFGVVGGVGTQARISKSTSELSSLSTALESYRQYFGDYPWVGQDSAADQIAPPSPASAGDRAFNLFRALGGRLKPRAVVVDANSDGIVDSLNTRQIDRAGRVVAKYSRPFIDFTVFTLERTKTSDSPTGSPLLPLPAQLSTDSDPDFVNAILDPWGNRYLYYYKNLADNGRGWKSSAYVLFSAGPDGLVDYSNGDKAAGNPPDPESPVNADNIYARP